MGKSGGSGRGMGRGMQSGSATGPDSGAQQHSREQELQALKNKSQSLAQQLSDIQRRIDVLGEK